MYNVLCTSVKVIGPLGKGETFDVADFKLLEDFERTTHAEVVHAKVCIYTVSLLLSDLVF